MNDKDSALYQFTISLGDESLVLGQRLSFLCSRGPTLEEDIALTNTALDYVGRARFFYQFANTLKPQKQGEDFFAYYRDSSDFLNRTIYETDNGDYAYTMLRQYLIDVFEQYYFTLLGKSNVKQINEICNKVVKECTYHLRRSSTCIDFLANSTETALQKLQKAADSLFPLSNQLFIPSVAEKVLGDAINIRIGLKKKWLDTINKKLRGRVTISGIESETENKELVIQHQKDFPRFIAELQYLTKLHPNCTW